MKTILYIDDIGQESSTKVVLHNSFVEEGRFYCISYDSDRNTRIRIKTNNPHILAHELEAVAQQLRRMGE